MLIYVVTTCQECYYLNCQDVEVLSQICGYCETYPHIPVYIPGKYTVAAYLKGAQGPENNINSMLPIRTFDRNTLKNICLQYLYQNRTKMV